MSSLKRLLTYSHQYRWKIFLAICSASIYGIAAAMPTYILKHTVDDIFVNKFSHLIIPFMLLFVFFFALKGIFMFFTVYFMHWVGNRVVNDIRIDLFEKVVYYPLSFFRKTTTGQLMSHFLNDIQMIQQASSMAIKNGVRSLFEALFLISFAFLQNWQLALMMLVVGPFIAITIKRMGARVKIASRGIQEEMGKISSMLQEIFVGIREIKAFGGEPVETGRFKRQLKNCFSSIMTNVRIESLMPACIEVMATSAGSFVFYVAAKQVLAGTITPGQLTSFIAAILLTYQPIKKLVGVYSEVQYGLAAAERVFAIMDMVHPALEDRTQELTSFKQGISFNNVTFAYNSEKTVFDKVDLTIKRGECVGIVGPSGAGKSTFCDLLLGFLSPTNGSITIDDKNINSVSFKSLRSKIGYVGQRTFLFNDTIKRNIAYSLPHASDEQIVAACKAACAHDFIEQAPQQYDTIVGEDGTLLSGGQKQRLTIARALVKDPDILIFDEPTSSLDQDSEMMIQEAIQKLGHEKTLIIVSHRPSLLKQADRVIKIEDGKISTQ